MKVKVNYTTFNNIYYQSNQEMFMQLITLLENYPCSYGSMLRAKGKKRFLQMHPNYVPPYKELYDWINSSLPLLSDSFYRISTKCFWILNGLTDFPQCHYKGCTFKHIKYNVQFNMKDPYPLFCKDHVHKDPTTLEKFKNTCQKNFGTDFPTQSPIIKEKVKQTNMKNLGYESPLQCPKCRELGKQTRLREHGDENWSNHEKAAETYKRHMAEDPNFILNIRNQVHNTNIKNGHCKNWTNRDQAIQSRLNNHDGIYWTDDMRKKYRSTQDKHRQENPNYDKDIQEKIQKTNIKNYGVSCTLQSNTTKEKLNKWIIEHGGKTNVFQTQYAKEKRKCTMITTYGVEHSLQSNEIKSKYNFKEINSKGQETKRRNGTFNTSKPEEISYEKLCYHFGINDIIRQYKSDKYPFNCDFYVKSLNLYIECNYCWTHGEHFFDENNEEDIKKLELWKSKQTDFYNNAINNWTIRDIEKRDTAIKNDLKYIVFWKYYELLQWLADLSVCI